MYAIPETLAVGLAWLFLRGRNFDAALTTVGSLVRFILLGILLPATVVALGVQTNLLLTGVLPSEQWALASLTLWRPG